MVFSSYLFIFLFFPIFIVLYLAVPKRASNLLILAASLLFYYFGEGKGIWILLVAIVGNYAFGYLIERAKCERRSGGSNQLAAKRFLGIGVALNLVLLGYFKYAGFLTQNINAVAESFGGAAMVPMLHVALPLGVSFFVFQGISYLVDVYRGTIHATSSLLNFATYKALFPQLIAGPIVRYRDVAKELVHRDVDADIFYEGVRRFVIGFCKKVLLADVFAVTADAIFAVPASDLSAGAAWLGAISYGLQIYFDFSAYSDMAIGMALMMGFRFPENFNYPYSAVSIKDFWRRWHITLSTWFRDYLYVPLGGNRKGAFRTYLNLVIVFALTGLWHGASWTFVVWGMWHGLFMVLERLTKFDQLPIPRLVRHLYVLLVVLVGWVFFKAVSFEYGFDMLRAMAGLADSGMRSYAEFSSPALILALFAGMIGSVPTYRFVRERMRSPASAFAGFTFMAVLLSFAGMKTLSGAYSPFLYFRF